jgi:hypothetical protein
MKTKYWNLDTAPNRTAFADFCFSGPAACQIIADSGEWARDATIESLLDPLLQCPFNALAPHEPAELRCAIAADFGGGLEELIDVSAEMRGLIFRAYARLIAQLLVAHGTAGHRPAGDRKLN